MILPPAYGDTWAPPRASLNSTRRPSPSLSSSSVEALDFGLRVRIEAHPPQRSIFCGAEPLPVEAFTSELADLVAELRVHSFAMRHELEQVTSALQRNVDSGFWALARRGGLGSVGTLFQARQRRLADPDLCSRGASGPLRIAELCAAGGRRRPATTRTT